MNDDKVFTSKENDIDEDHPELCNESTIQIEPKILTQEVSKMEGDELQEKDSNKSNIEHVSMSISKSKPVTLKLSQESKSDINVHDRLTQDRRDINTDYDSSS